MKTKLLLFSTLVAVFTLLSSSLKAQEVINIGVNDSIKTALVNYTGGNSAVTVVLPTGYTSPEFMGSKNIDLSSIPASIQDLTIKYSSTTPDTLLLKQFVLPARAMNSFTVENAILSGVNEVTSTKPYTIGNYIINATTAINVTNFALKNCHIANVRGVIRLQGAQTLTNISLDNCIIRNVGNAVGSSYSLLTPATTSVVKTISLTNSTVYGFNANFLPLSNIQTILTSVTIDHCTFDQIMLGSTGKYLIDFGSTGSSTASVAVTNSIFGRVAASNKGVRTFATGQTTTFTGNYATTDWVLSSNTFTTTAYTGTYSALFRTPTVIDATNLTATVGDYAIIDAAFEGKTSAGDPRWYYGNTSAIKTINSSDINIIVADGKIQLSEAANAEIINISGKAVKSVTDVQTISTSDLSAGIYIVKATNATGSKIQKVVIK
ncbi:DUF5123 domain-containing protein [Parabacteroides sp. FAFU027]|uniref:DUF5123 domain-containing protein n=1 Tax=Parabacteroides sp. FAFU027 TaxID=2922715 RepID=UPI001FAF7C5A|nr:DUF5123 domain-containing protein [Parabacteroides sp. FAFU027]